MMENPSSRADIIYIMRGIREAGTSRLRSRLVSTAARAKRVRTYPHYMYVLREERMDWHKIKLSIKVYMQLFMVYLHRNLKILKQKNYLA